jgi:hypothetical protein
MVYFIADTTNDIVKIGWSKNVKKRLQQLQTSNGNILVLLGYMDGNRLEEQYLHTLFDKYRLNSNGEWFLLDKYDDVILDYININNLMYCSVERIDGKIYRLNKMKM